MRPPFDLRFHNSNPGSHVGRSSGWRHEATTSLRWGAGLPRPPWPKRWPVEAPRCWCWSEKSNSKTVCAERLLCLGAWPKLMNSDFAACSRKSAPMKCLTLRLVRGYETSERRGKYPETGFAEIGRANSTPWRDLSSKKTSGPNTLRKLVLDPFAAQQTPTMRITKEEPALHETVPAVVPIFSSRCGFCDDGVGFGPTPSIFSSP